GETTSADCREGAWLLKKKATPMMTSDDTAGTAPVSAALTSGADSQPSLSDDDSSKPGPGAAAAWQRLAPAGQSFSVLMPGSPSEFAMAQGNGPKIYMTVGGENLFIVSSVYQKGGFTSTGFDKDPAAALQGGFTPALEEMLKKSDPSASIVYDRRLDSAGHSGLQFRVNSSQTPGIFRFFWTNDRMFVLVAMGRNLKDPGVEKFLNSFKILP